MFPTISSPTWHGWRHSLCQATRLKLLQTTHFKAPLIRLRLLDLSHEKHSKWPIHWTGSLGRTNSCWQQNYSSRPTRGDILWTSGVEIVNLSHNKLQTIPNGLFVGLATLRTLTLSGNEIATIGLPEGLSSGLHLKLLGLSDNPLASVNIRSFKDASVTVLDLSGCQLDELPVDLGRKLESSPKEDNVSNNLIHDVPNVRYEEDLVIDLLDLSGNVIKEGTCFWLGNTTQITYLHKNNIKAIEDCFSTGRMLTLIILCLTTHWNVATSGGLRTLCLRPIRSWTWKTAAVSQTLARIWLERKCLLQTAVKMLPRHHVQPLL